MCLLYHFVGLLVAYNSAHRHKGALKLQVGLLDMQVWKSEVQSGKMCTGGKYKYGKIEYGITVVTFFTNNYNWW